MRCYKSKEYLGLYHDGELRGRALSEFEQHLKSCRDCENQLGWLEHVDELVYSAETADKVASLAAYEEAGERLNVTLNRYAYSESNHPARRWVAAAIALLGIAVSSFILSLRSTRDSGGPTFEYAGAPLVYNRVAWNHEFCGRLVSLFGGWGTSAAQVDKLLGNNLSNMSSAVEYESEGYKVVNAHTCPIRGQKFVHIYYESDKGLLSLFIKEKGAELFRGIPSIKWDDLDVHYASVRDYGIAGFERGGRCVVVVSPDAGAETLTLLSLAVRQAGFNQ